MTPDESHPEFLELCALATAGSLTGEEEQRLAAHLSSCAACREAMAQYETIAGKVVPGLNREEVDTESDRHMGSWSIEQAEKSLFERLDKEAKQSQSVPYRSREVVPPSPPVPVEEDAVWRHMWWLYAASILLLTAMGFAVYRMGIHHGKEGDRIAVSVPAAPSVVPSSPPPSPAPAADLELSRQVASLHEQLKLQATQIEQLKAAELQAAGSRDESAAENQRLAGERASLEQQLSAAQASLRDVQGKLDAAVNQSAANSTERVALEAEVGQLRDMLRERDHSLSDREALLDRDRDIRELMGARDLYIAEVYDVAKDGDTEKPFGRVFYTKGKSLIFYAYDLDQQAGLKNVGTFQAWGRRGPDTEHAVSLGILFQDDANKKRWVMKTRDPKTLHQIDAVFVTVEPNGGSAHPSGKPFLFAYLRNDPNHP